VKDNFDKAMSFVLSWEGGYSNRSDDPGGETNFGISKRAFPHLDIKNMTKEVAIEIYREVYWQGMKCDELPFPLDIVVMDTAVNMGVGRAQTFLEWSKNNWRDYIIIRIAKYLDLGKKQPQFLAGWLNRIISLWRMIKT
jgi:lysozyme family protein